MGWQLVGLFMLSNFLVESPYLWLLIHNTLIYPVFWDKGRVLWQDCIFGVYWGLLLVMIRHTDVNERILLMF